MDFQTYSEQASKRIIYIYIYLFIDHMYVCLKSMSPINIDQLKNKRYAPFRPVEEFCCFPVRFFDCRVSYAMQTVLRRV